MTDKIQPFSSLTAYICWRDKNCEKCKKNYQIGMEPEGRCEIEAAIALASCASGEIDREIANRLPLTDQGFVDGNCPEFEEKD